MSLNRVLIADDDGDIRESLKNFFIQLGFDAQTAENGEKAMYLVRSNQLQGTPFQFVITDFRMPGVDGFDVLKEVKRTSPSARVIVMTGMASVHHAVQAMQAGADDYIAKPFSLDDMEKIVLKSLPKSTEPTKAIGILSVDPSFQAILQKAERAARSNAPILIEGPSGTGKELLARQVHEWSPRRSKPWVAINCAALPAGLLESELFGFEKGAFTGAIEKKPGKFEQANGGTLLLDEIGELDPILQAKLLRVLQEGEVDRLGGKKSCKIDVRIIATTNKNLEQLVRTGQFREDLFFRLYGVRFILPSLKDRPQDIAMLVTEFLNRQATILGRTLTLDADVLTALEQRAWTGNIRELERSVERAAVLSEDGLVRLSHFEFTPDLSSLRPTIPPTTHEAAQAMAAAIQPKRSIREMEQDIILRALDAHQGNRTHTAKALGMSLRTLRHKLKQYREQGIAVDRVARQNLVGSFRSDEKTDAALDYVSHASTNEDTYGAIIALEEETVHAGEA